MEQYKSGNTDDDLNTTKADPTTVPRASLAIRHLRRFQLRPQRLQSSRIDELRRLHDLPSILIHLTPEQNLVLYHFRVVLRLHVEHRPHHRTSLLRIHVHVRDVNTPRLQCWRHALESSDEVFWRFIALEVRRCGDKVEVAEAKDCIGREETEDVVVVWIVAAGCLRAGGGYPV